MATTKLGDYIRTKREEKGLSLEELSKLADMSLQALTAIEDGGKKSPSMEALGKIIHALGIDCIEFLEDSGIKDMEEYETQGTSSRGPIMVFDGPIKDRPYERDPAFIEAFKSIPGKDDLGLGPINLDLDKPNGG